MKHPWHRIVVLLAVLFLTATLFAQPPVENPDPDGGGNGSGDCEKCRWRWRDGAPQTTWCSDVMGSEVGATSCNADCMQDGNSATCYCQESGVFCMVVEVNG